MISQKNKQFWRNPWVLGLLVLVLAGVLTNIRLVWNVINNPVRMLDDDYNVKKHNQYDAKWVQQQAERSTLGWQAKLHSPQQLQNDPLATKSAARFIVMASPAQFKLQLNDRDGKPLPGGKVTINAQWPGGPSHDFVSTLYETGSGQYEGSINFPRAGNWDLLIKSQHDDSEFAMEQKVFVAISK